MNGSSTTVRPNFARKASIAVCGIAALTAPASFSGRQRSFQPNPQRHNYGPDTPAANFHIDWSIASSATARN
jgi:hypothetical protein